MCPLELVSTPTASPMVWPGTFNCSTSSLYFSFGVLASIASCSACCALVEIWACAPVSALAASNAPASDNNVERFMESPRLYYGGCSIAGTSLSQHTDLPCLAEGCCAKLLIFLLDKVFEG